MVLGTLHFSQTAFSYRIGKRIDNTTTSNCGDLPLACCESCCVSLDTGDITLNYANYGHSGDRQNIITATLIYTVDGHNKTLGSSKETVTLDSSQLDLLQTTLAAYNPDQGNITVTAPGILHQSVYEVITSNGQSTYSFTYYWTETIPGMSAAITTTDKHRSSCTSIISNSTRTFPCEAASQFPQLRSCFLYHEEGIPTTKIVASGLLDTRFVTVPGISTTSIIPAEAIQTPLQSSSDIAAQAIALAPAPLTSPLPAPAIASSHDVPQNTALPSQPNSMILSNTESEVATSLSNIFSATLGNAQPLISTNPIPSANNEPSSSASRTQTAGSSITPIAPALMATNLSPNGVNPGLPLPTTIVGQTLVKDSSGYIVLGITTLMPGGPAANVSGSPVSLDTVTRLFVGSSRVSSFEAASSTSSGSVPSLQTMPAACKAHAEVLGV
ncbi:MAG: hypothetical protein M1829_005432 [Trizodia sp. TS-e1964]|nr:MAG: hypothetical protein M1829_005432 [Trizodia sp. TS-e1964]